jgi:hypothetical protein
MKSRAIGSSGAIRYPRCAADRGPRQLRFSPVTRTSRSGKLNCNCDALDDLSTRLEHIGVIM